LYPTGTDFEKLKWTPGIYDRVSLHFADNPAIEAIQVAPRIATSEIVVQTKLKNRGATACSASLAYTVKPWKGGKQVAVSEALNLPLQPGEEKTFTQTIAVPGVKLWSPEEPFLYTVETRTGGDSVTTRFGMREFRSDTKTHRFYLNGKPYYLRGSNITLHRFFEDPGCGGLPWDEKWLRKLLVETPKQMHWNAFRFCIGPVPDQWLEIADEAGLLIQNEFFIWTGPRREKYTRSFDVPEMTRQFSDWMRDNWNHPSVAIWDACNETFDPIFSQIIPAVRGLDLSNRPWDNGYNPPAGPDDPVEHHPYLMQSTATGEGIKFRMSDLEKRDDLPDLRERKTEHPILINEYGWLWLNRDGSPTLLTGKLYSKLLGPNSTAEERRALDSYLLAGKTEFWRANRRCAGILHFVYLTSNYPGVYTSDHWLDVKQLKLEPHFADYMAEAFRPLGVYLNFFQPTLPPGAEREFTVKLVNDEDRPLHGRLTLTLETPNGKVVTRIGQDFSLPALGAATVDLRLAIPEVAGKHILKASAQALGPGRVPATLSRRWVTLESPK
jgi:beta-galactosidase